jgi:6-pyruvoyltetrahydropterin/6-carboxytetrahydropterin synthase
MQLIRITKEFKFEMAHALSGHDGPCRHIHGHSYELFVTIKGHPLNDPSSPKNGMVMDFGDLKKIVKSAIIDRFDHALVLNSRFKSNFCETDNDLFAKVIWVDFQPSSENLLIYFAEILKPLLPATVRLHSLKLRETVTSFAEWYADDND